MIAIGTGILCIISFIVGAIIGQKTIKGEDIKLPNLNPINAIHDIEDSIQTRKEIERNKVIAENIDNYDGTGFGQKDVPK